MLWTDCVTTGNRKRKHKNYWIEPQDINESCDARINQTKLLVWYFSILLLVCDATRKLKLKFPLKTISITLPVQYATMTFSKPIPIYQGSDEGQN